MAIQNHQRIVGARDTKANIEALTGTLEEQAIAYATDTGELGIYTNGAWVWITTDTVSHFELLQDEDGNPITDENGEYLYTEVNDA